MTNVFYRCPKCDQPWASHGRDFQGSECRLICPVNYGSTKNSGTAPAKKDQFVSDATAWTVAIAVFAVGIPGILIFIFALLMLVGC